MMIKLSIAFILFIPILFANTLVPTLTTVTFTPGVTFPQVVELLQQHDAWPDRDVFRATDLGFVYRRDGVPVGERSREVWLSRQSFAQLNGETPDATVSACLAAPVSEPVQPECAINITQIALLNAPSALLNSPLIASATSRRTINRFFLGWIPDGHPTGP